MANVTTDADAEHAAAAGRRDLVRFEEDTPCGSGRCGSG
jgi:hypothetical protein